MLGVETIYLYESGLKMNEAVINLVFVDFKSRSRSRKSTHILGCCRLKD